jgi:adenine-specific DNA methylase
MSRCLIECSLPLEVISAQSARERSTRYGFISTLHIWWAWKRKRLRQPLVACRASTYGLVCLLALAAVLVVALFA